MKYTSEVDQYDLDSEPITNYTILVVQPLQTIILYYNREMVASLHNSKDTPPFRIDIETASQHLIPTSNLNIKNFIT